MKKLPLLLLPLLFTRCHKEATDNCFPVDPNVVDVALNNCAEKAAEDNPPTICYTQRIEDSRCPATAVCASAGIGVAQFTIKVGATVHTVTLATQSLPGRPSTDTTVGGRRVKLLDLLPHPGTTNEPPYARLRID